MARRLLVAATLLVTLLAAREASRRGGRAGHADTVAAMMSARSVAAAYARLPDSGVAVLTAPAIAAAR